MSIQLGAIVGCLSICLNSIASATDDSELQPADSPATKPRAVTIDAPRARNYRLTPYKQNYVLPLSYNVSPHSEPFQLFRPTDDIDKIEAKFQLSMEVDLWRNMFNRGMDLYFGYTQTAFWQAYNGAASSPFRETNYEPEGGVILRPVFNVRGFDLRELRLGIVHHSNGQSDPLSRNWNRLFASIILEKRHFATSLRVWYRIPESDDDNPDITDFLGHFEWSGIYEKNGQTFGLMLRNNLNVNSNRGAVQFDWTYPLTDRLNVYVQYFNGYGESLVDYNDSTSRFGVGLLVTGWL